MKGFNKGGNNNKKDGKFSSMKKKVLEIIIIAAINLFFVIISIILNRSALFKNNNYINLVKKSSNSLSNFEKFWCDAGNAELKVLISYLVFILILITIELILYNNTKFLKTKIKIKLNFPCFILFCISFSLINYLIVYSIIFISISPVKYQGIFHISNKNKSLTLDEEIEIEDTVGEFEQSKFIHIIYIIILFIILYLNILISILIYKSIICKKKEETGEKKGKKKEDKKEKQEENKMQEIYNWKYPRINIIYKFLESFYLGLFFILHLSSFLFQLNISNEEKYKELLNCVKEGEIETPKNYSIIKMYGIFEKVVTYSFSALNLISFAFVVVSMFKKMLSDIITEGFDSEKPKLLSCLLSSNILYSIFVILLIVFSGICYSSFNKLDENEDLNYFIIKKKLIGQIIVNSFIFIFLIIIIIDNIRLSYILKKKSTSENKSTNNQDSHTNFPFIKNYVNSTERHLHEGKKKKNN